MELLAWLIVGLPVLFLGLIAILMAAAFIAIPLLALYALVVAFFEN